MPQVLDVEAAIAARKYAVIVDEPHSTVDRFKALTDETQGNAFREKLGGYVQLYSFLSQIVRYADAELEMLYSYGKFLLPHLPLDRDNTVLKLSDEVGLQYYRLERVYSGAIELKEGDSEDRRIHDPTHGGQRQDRDALYGRSGISERLFSNSGEGNLRRGSPGQSNRDRELIAFTQATLTVDHFVAPHFQFRISGRSWPWSAVYCLCSMSLSRMACFAYAALGPSCGTRSMTSATR